MRIEKLAYKRRLSNSHATDGRVTIPQALLDVIGANPGDTLLLVSRGNEIVITKNAS